MSDRAAGAGKSAAMRRWLQRSIENPLRARVGGARRLREIVLLASVLALSTADLGIIGAIAVPLKSSLGIDNAGIGVLVSAATAVGAVATLPMGVISDRASRVNLLSVTIIIWCVAIGVCGAARSYPMLLISRLGLGVVVAAAGPAVASLAGDLFPSAARGRIYGYILSGEIVGVAIGILLCGNVAAVLSWRFGFWILVPPGLYLAWAIHRLLPEPVRGGGENRGAGQRRPQPRKKNHSSGRRRTTAPITTTHTAVPLTRR